MKIKDLLQLTKHKKKNKHATYYLSYIRNDIQYDTRKSLYY